jgi:hypothetical protein
LLGSIENGTLPSTLNQEASAEHGRMGRESQNPLNTDNQLGLRSSDQELFDPMEMTRSELLSLDLNKLTPLEALNLLSKWKNDLA